jgi:hypothetical protein
LVERSAVVAGRRESAPGGAGARRTRFLVVLHAALGFITLLALVTSFGTSTARPHGGNETTVVSLFIPMTHLGFIIVPNGYTHEKIVQGHGTPYGSSSTSGQNSARPTVDELVVVKHQGARVTQVAAALKAAR